MNSMLLKIIILCISIFFLGNIPAFASSGILQENEQEIQNILPIFPPLFSTNDDENIDVFTSRYVGLTNKNYIPNDLLSIADLGNIHEAGRLSKLRKVAQEHLGLLGEAFLQEFNTPLVVISAYRSAEYQQRMWDLGKCNATLCAPPGYSEHQLGLAIDIFDATTEEEYFENKKYREYISWLQENAHKYGWNQSYQNGEYIDAYEIEPWHWRYVGVDLATKLKALDMSYTEYIRFERILAFWRR